eukprot:6176331-Pleurochrysis_carterae.AAC.3
MAFISCRRDQAAARGSFMVAVPPKEEAKARARGGFEVVEMLRTRGHRDAHWSARHQTRE